MVLVRPAGREKYDLSFMYSNRCDLECPFCMYSSSPNVEAENVLALNELLQFITTIDFSMINSFGFYGGEPSLFIEENSRIMDLLPQSIPKFVITNGTWSHGAMHTSTFLSWCKKYDLKVFISRTPYHRGFQNEEVIQVAVRDNDFITLKEPDTKMIPMGRLAKPIIKCTSQCSWDIRPTRLAIQSDGSVIFQTCDGSYPVVGHIREGFDKVCGRVKQEVEWEFPELCRHVERVEI